MIGQSLRAIPIGRDVVVDVARFDMAGRKFRNLRQAVQRTHNSGITTEIVAEQELDDERRAELAEVVRASPSGAHNDRGFYMNLDGVLEGRFPGILLIIARDAFGKGAGLSPVRDRRRRWRYHPGCAVASARGSERYRRTAQRRHDRGR